MPGILGVMYLKRRVDDHPLIDRMHDILMHEEWYGSFTCNKREFAGGAISTVPFFSLKNNSAEDDDFLIFFEGNGITIDHEVVFSRREKLADKILTLFLKDGDEFVQRLTGSFNIAIFNKKNKKLKLFNDRLGFSYLYYYKDENLFMFGPEVKTFLAYNEFDKTLNDKAIASYFSSNTIIGNDTFFKNVHMLPPASILEVKDKKISVNTYWKPQVDPNYDRSRKDWIEKALELYRFSLKKRLPADKSSKIIFPLTGGLDSRLQLELTRKEYDNLFIFTHGEPRSIDYKIAKQVARKIGMADKHRLIHVNPNWMSEYAYRTVWLTEGQVNLRNSYLTGVAKEIGPGPHTFINGIIGAHMSTGSLNFFSKNDMVPLSRIEDMTSEIEGMLGFNYSHPYFKHFMKKSANIQLRKIALENGLDKFRQYADLKLFSDQKDIFINYNIGRRMMGTIDVNKYFFYNILPFVDSNLFDLYLTLPGELKIRHLLYQDIFRNEFPDLANITWTNSRKNLYSKSKNTINDQMRKISKRGKYYIGRLTQGRVNIKDHVTYVHRSLWLRKNANFRKLIKDNFQYAKKSKIRVIDPAKLNHLLGEHDKGRDYLFNSIATVVTFIIWHRLFIDGENYLLKN